MSNQENIEELRMKHVLSKPELKDAIKNMRDVVRKSDGKKALFCLTHMIDAMESYDEVIDTLFAEIDSKESSLNLAVKALEEIHESDIPAEDGFDYVEYYYKVSEITEKFIQVRGKET